MGKLKEELKTENKQLSEAFVMLPKVANEHLINVPLMSIKY